MPGGAAAFQTAGALFQADQDNSIVGAESHALTTYHGMLARIVVGYRLGILEQIGDGNRRRSIAVGPSTTTNRSVTPLFS